MKVKSLADLRKIKDEVHEKIKLREQSENAEQIVQIKVAMATCGIASGAKEIMSYIIDELDYSGIDGVVTQTGCMGYCYAEPTIEVKLPGKAPVVYGFVTKGKAKEIIERYIIKGELVDGVIPVTYRTIDE
ncbi:MAG: (2Fe-2S) ferredoxin domain-containing protein [Prolixibacteraceae bacterium]|jgi:NADP-reducing hydrogenase subunit HndB|nr:(2Fe-2S) ferredoxin domain-containing protein [Prolixibacteraceae bacterium]